MVNIFCCANLNVYNYKLPQYIIKEYNKNNLLDIFTLSLSYL